MMNLRHEYGRLVATLTRRFGGQHLAIIEDAVQTALEKALVWPIAPDNPAAWLHRVAYNAALDELRRQARATELVDEPEPAGAEPDDVLRLLFMACDTALPIESQLVLALKTICGFDVPEIATRLFVTEANVYKRLTRARSRLAETPIAFELTVEQLEERRPAVLAILHLLFTEGHLSASADIAVRRELCAEALRLTELLAAHPLGASPETFALVALMHLHHARMSTRTDATGGLLLLEEQDRTRWDQAEIALGLEWLARSAEGERFSRYHAEAGIAAEHALAPSFSETRWDRVIANYELLERIAPSALHSLNRAVAIAERDGPAAGLALLDDVARRDTTRLEGSFMWSAVQADLHRRAGHAKLAERFREMAFAAAPTVAVRALLERRLT